MLSPADGSISVLKYDQHTSRLTDVDGVSITEHLEYRQHTDWSKRLPHNAVSPDNPAEKSRHVRRLKIQIGLACNYSCSYCLQSHEVLKVSAQSISDARKFMSNVDAWLIPDQLEKIEIWGGEPLMYWRTIEVLVPLLKEKYPNAKLSMITNGTMFNRQRIDQLWDWGFTIGMSHDGPGQAIREKEEMKDPFKNPKIFEQIQYLVSKFQSANRFSFNSVLTPSNCNVNEIIGWFQAKFPNVHVAFEGVVHDYNGDENASFTLPKLEQFSIELSKALIDGTAMRSGGMASKTKAAIDSIINERPSSILGQKCGMDTESNLAVDLEGNVVTCQNTGASDEYHKIGHVDDFDNIKLDTANHWSTRAECSSCPVLQLCQGSCMYQEGDNWVNSCNAEFYYNMAFFNAALYAITGKLLIGIEGNIIRPVLSKDINRQTYLQVDDPT
jgi:uncharacterized protein